MTDLTAPYATYAEFEAAGGILGDNNGIQSFVYLGETITGTCPRIIERTYQATDSCGNVAECVRTITQIDTEQPILTCPLNTNIECMTDVPAPYTTVAEFIAAGGMAIDNCPNCSARLK